MDEPLNCGEMIETEILIFQVIIIVLAAFCLVVFSIIFWLCFYFKKKVT